MAAFAPGIPPLTAATAALPEYIAEVNDALAGKVAAQVKAAEAATGLRIESRSIGLDAVNNLALHARHAPSEPSARACAMQPA